MISIEEGIKVKANRKNARSHNQWKVVSIRISINFYRNIISQHNHYSPLSVEKKSISSQAPAFYTLKKYAYELKFLYCYFIGLGIDLVERVNTGEFLSRQEVDDFVRACKLYADDTSTHENNVITISDKRIRDAIHATSNSQAQVSAHTLRQRLIRLRAYIEYLYVCHHYDQAPIRIYTSF